jgi:hypothetical protein
MKPSVLPFWISQIQFILFATKPLQYLPKNEISVSHNQAYNNHHVHKSIPMHFNQSQLNPVHCFAPHFSDLATQGISTQFTLLSTNYHHQYTQSTHQHMFFPFFHSNTKQQNKRKHFNSKRQEEKEFCTKCWQQYPCTHPYVMMAHMHFRGDETHTLPWWLMCTCLSLCQLLTTWVEIHFWVSTFWRFPVTITVLWWLHVELQLQRWKQFSFTLHLLYSWEKSSWYLLDRWLAQPWSQSQ